MTSVPSRFNVTSDSYRRDQALQALRRDGAVILTHIRPAAASSWETCASRVPQLLWDADTQLLLGHDHKACGIHHDNGPFALEGKRLHPHSDGYVWGDAYPDVVILCCEQEGVGGDSFLVDGHTVVDRLDPQDRAVLSTAVVDHTERVDCGAIADGAESHVPVLRWQDTATLWKEDDGSPISSLSDDDADVPKQRLVWRRQLHVDYVYERRDPIGHYNSLWGSEDERVKSALMNLDQTILQVEKESAMFQLKSGEALIADNFRMLHARGSFSTKAGDVQRRMWRVWAWTDASFGLPDVMKDGTITATVKDTEQALAEAQ